MPVNQLSPTTAPTQTPTLDFDIAIVGGGIVGATLASALKDSGLKIAIIETQLPAAAAAKKQAYAITLLSGMILEGIGVWQQIPASSNSTARIWEILANCPYQKQL
jgi:2-octaprenyl-6-methoxyphenol hydroxylase